MIMIVLKLGRQKPFRQTGSWASWILQFRVGDIK